MKRIKLIIIPVAILVVFAFNTKEQNANQSVNPVLGDVSFMAKYGIEPNETVDNQLRIVTHLEYVEKLLREKDDSHLSFELKSNRAHLLDLLHDYWTAGIFPKNYDYKDQRKPCFIDKDGNICAVGYLVEQTAGREAAESINSKFKYENLLAMNDQSLENWVASSGLTKEECAMIQPTYGFPEDSNDFITPQYGISSSLLSGVNFSVSAVNGINLNNSQGSKFIPKLGFVTGTSQLVLGIASYGNQDVEGFGEVNSNRSHNLVSMLNIGLGSSTLFLSVYRLISNRPVKEKSTSWNLYNFQAAENQAGIGLRFTKRF